MASPGPRLRDLIDADSDVEDSDGNEMPVAPRRRAPLHAPALLSAAESDDENPPPRRVAPKKGTGRRRGRGGATAPTRAQTADDTEAGSVYVFIDPESLVKTKKSADSDYFFGRRTIDQGFKCRLCVFVFSPLFKVQSILILSAGKNIHLGQVLPPAAFISRTPKATWKLTSPQFNNTGSRTSYRKFYNRRQTKSAWLTRNECHSL